MSVFPTTEDGDTTILALALRDPLFKDFRLTWPCSFKLLKPNKINHENFARTEQEKKKTKRIVPSIALKPKGVSEAFQK